MCLVEDNRRPRSSEQTPPMPMAFAHSPASRSEGAAERHLTVAVGFSPRTAGKTERRRVATFDPAIGPAIHRSCVAPRRDLAAVLLFRPFNPCFLIRCDSHELTRENGQANNFDSL